MSTGEQDQPGQSVIGQPLERDDGRLKITSRRVTPPIRRWTTLFTARCCPTPPTVIRPDLGQPTELGLAPSIFLPRILWQVLSSPIRYPVTMDAFGQPGLLGRAAR